MNLKQIEENLKLTNILPNYKVKKWIFRSALILIVLLSFVAWGSLGFGDPAKNYIYIECPAGSVWACDNPFFNLCNSEGALYYTKNKLCDDLDPSFYESEFLFPNTKIGEKPPLIASLIVKYAWIIIILAFVFNHLLYNKKYFRKNKEYFKNISNEVSGGKKMKGFKIKALTNVGRDRLRVNMESDKKVVILTLCDDPLIVSFVYNKNAFRLKDRFFFNLLANERAVRVATSDSMAPAIIDIDFVVEVI